MGTESNLRNHHAMIIVGRIRRSRPGIDCQPPYESQALNALSSKVWLSKRCCRRKHVYTCVFRLKKKRAPPIGLPFETNSAQAGDRCPATESGTGSGMEAPEHRNEFGNGFPISLFFKFLIILYYYLTLSFGLLIIQYYGNLNELAATGGEIYSNILF